MVQYYNCTRIYIAKYRQSIAFRYIYIGGHFSVAREGRKLQTDLRKSHKPPFVVVLNTTLCSLDVDIKVVRTTASDKGQERRLP